MEACELLGKLVVLATCLLGILHNFPYRFGKKYCVARREAERHVDSLNCWSAVIFPNQTALALT